MFAQSHQRQPTRPPARKAGAPAPIEGDDQSLYGNSFVADQAAGPTFEDGSPIPTQQGAEVTDDFDPATRDADLSTGETGALIGRGTEVVIRSGRTKRSREIARVPDGAPCEIVQVKGTKIQVRVRVGEKNVVGWTDASAFSKQPTLPKDEDHKDLRENFAYSYFAGDHSPKSPKGTDTSQGALGDCFFIATMAAIANASPKAIEEAIKYDAKTGKYTVRFFEESYTGQMKPVFITVDGYLPTEAASRGDPAYDGDPGMALWPAIMEKAYAQWKGGYDVIGEGGTGHQAMAELTGVRSKSKSPSSMSEKEVVPYFEKAKKDGLAIYAGVKDTMKSATQAPLAGSASGPYSGTLTQTHRWNEVEPGTLRVTDKNNAVASARDTGSEGDKTASVEGRDVTKGEIDYKSSHLSVQYAKGKAPKKASDLAVDFEYHGMLDTAKTIIGNHAYAFESVVDGKLLQFYNPWGTYQPKPITAAEFLKYFDSLSTNQVPAGKTAA